MTSAHACRFTAVLLAGCALVGAMAGCTGSPVGRDVRIDARKEAGAITFTSYRLRNATPANESDSLRHQEISNFVKTALSGRGFHEAPDNASADVIIDLDYGAIAPGTREEVVRLPAYRTLPGRTETSVFVVGTDSRGKDQVIRHRHRDPDRRVLVGHQQVTMTNTHHERFLKLTARRNRPNSSADNPEEVWSVEVRTKGNDNDLREDLPLLAATAIGHIGRETRGRMIVRIAGDDPAVEFVKNQP